MPHKAVHDRVDAAVEVGDADSEGHGCVNDFQEGTVCPPHQLGEHLHEVEHLMGRPAQEEGQDSRGEHAQDLVVPGTGALLDVSRPYQRSTNEAVAGDDADEGQQEAQQAFHEAEGEQELLQR